MHVIQVEKETWLENFSESAHKIAFNEIFEKQRNRLDYALLVVSEDDVPIGYITVRELDSDSCYWQFGGAMPNIIKTVGSWKAYQACIEWASTRYKRIATHIENTNAVMLKFAAKAGFKIVGVRNFKGSILLEHLMEFDDGNKFNIRGND